jgi:hypothetical protein
MKVADFYDITHHFFRDVLGYWLPGLYLTIILLFRYSNIDNLEPQRIIALFNGVNIYSFLLFILFGILSGYISLPIAHLLFMPFAKWSLKHNEGVQGLLSIRKQLSKSLVDQKLSSDLFFAELKADENLKSLFGKYILYLRAEVDQSEYYKALIPRHNSLRLFHENVTLIFLVSGFLFWSWGLWWSIICFVLMFFNCFAALYNTKKWEVRRQCLAIIALLKQNETSK